MSETPYGDRLAIVKYLRTKDKEKIIDFAVDMMYTLKTLEITIQEEFKDVLDDDEQLKKLATVVKK